MTPTPKDIAYELRVATKRADLPIYITRLLSEAYYCISSLLLEKEKSKDIITEDIMMRNQELTMEVETLRSELQKIRNLSFGINDEAKQLREERDAARREICSMLQDATNTHRHDHAKMWGWDCYKEEK